jgi:hypothetical protein
MNRIPELDRIDDYRRDLVRMVARTSWLPHPDTVAAFKGAVFPTVRARKGHLRQGQVKQGERSIGMYDDNTTPRWALLWAHGIPDTHHPSGRTFAHVWEGADDIAAYTHLANLVMVLEPFAALTDKRGPLTGYLRWHAWTRYGWKPEHAPKPVEPEDYEAVTWRYLPVIDDPCRFVWERLRALNNGRSRTLIPIMQELGWPGF